MKLQHVLITGGTHLLAFRIEHGIKGRVVLRLLLRQHALLLQLQVSLRADGGCLQLGPQRAQLDALLLDPL